MLYFVAEQVPCSCSPLVPSCLPVILVIKHRPICLSIVSFPLLESMLVIFWLGINRGVNCRSGNGTDYPIVETAKSKLSNYLPTIATTKDHYGNRKDE